MAMVTGSINEPGMYSSGTGLLPATEWRKAAVRFRQLDDLAKRVKALERAEANKTS
jgi:UDP-3-O-[3-hydroxymyristoyl] glucosamine N-acyltransferase